MKARYFAMLFAVSALATMLTACSGGGGGGYAQPEKRNYRI